MIELAPDIKISKLTLQAACLIILTKMLGMSAVILSFMQGYHSVSLFLISLAFASIIAAITLASVQLKRESSESVEIA